MWGGTIRGGREGEAQIIDSVHLALIKHILWLMCVKIEN